MILKSLNLDNDKIQELISQAKNYMPSKNKIELTNKELTKFIDHTLLKPDACEKDILRLCNEAIEYSFFSVCVNPVWVEFCFNHLKSTNVKVCTVIGFPIGSNKTEIKLIEAEKAISDGAEELDMVINIGKLKSSDYEYVYDEIKQLADLTKKFNSLLKVIIETCLLTDEEKVIASVICKYAGADFIKTSTGFSTGGAKLEDVILMKIAGDNLLVKASGGIKSKNDAINFIVNGASRLGTSSGIKIINDETISSGY